MPSWTELLHEANQTGGTFDVVRHKYIRRLHSLTKRNIIIYYSGWLSKGNLQAQLGTTVFSINDSDINALMATIHKLDREKGLDLILHTPGGDMLATEAIIHYLRKMFPDDIRAIVPQLAMSGGTMIALACNRIVMGKHSSLGPVDPLVGGLPAEGVISEWRRANQEVALNRSQLGLWQPIIAKYGPTLIGNCEKAVKLAEEVVSRFLKAGMFRGDSDAEEKASRVLNFFKSHDETLSHGRHITPEQAKDFGVVIDMLEDDQKLQDAVLNVHHLTMLTLQQTGALKIVENHQGNRVIPTINAPSGNK